MASGCFLVACIVLLSWTFSLSNGRLMKLVLLTDAPETHGAVCLDGSPPGFYFRPGIRDGKSKWIIHLQGGGFCQDECECAELFLASTSGLQRRLTTRKDGILSNFKQFNPDFYNWNVASVVYCDGAFYAGYREEPIEVKGRTVYFRGFRILQAVLDALMNMGMKRATDVILTGCSAGGQASLFHADYVRSLFSPNVKYAVMPDSGIYPFSEDRFQEFSGIAERLFNFHNMSASVDADCVAQLRPSNEEWKCFFAEFLIPYVESPIFAINAFHDTSSLLLIFRECESFVECSAGDLSFQEVLKAIREEFLFASAGLRSQNGTGYYFSSCLRLCQSIDDSWYGSVRVEGQIIRETFANWYFERSGQTRVLDCEDYPCNDSCGNPRNSLGYEVIVNNN